jgi:HPt (histidine-containing phosphotransfer) domain-containing protein
MCRCSKTLFVRELHTILQHDTQRQDMMFETYRAPFAAILLGIFITSYGLVSGVFTHSASAYRDSQLALVLVGMATGPPLVLHLLLFIGSGCTFRRPHFAYLIGSSSLMQGMFFVMVKVHCSNMRVSGDPAPFSAQLLDESQKESFWCKSPGNDVALWMLQTIVSILLYVGPFTFVEMMACVGITATSLFIKGILEDDENKIQYFCVACFWLGVHILFKAVLVAKEYTLHVSVPGKDRRFLEHVVPGGLGGDIGLGGTGSGGGKMPPLLWDTVPISSTNFSLLADVQVELHSSQQNGRRSKLHITDFLSQTSNDLLSCIATMSTTIDFLRSCSMSDVGRHWWMLEAHRTVMQRMMTMIVSQQDFVSIVRKQTISRPSVERVSVENLLKDIAGLTQEHFFRHVLKIKYVIDKRIAGRLILSDRAWLRHMLMICLSHARNTMSGEKGKIEVRALLLDANHSDRGGTDADNVDNASSKDDVSLHVVETKQNADPSDAIRADEGRLSFGSWGQRPMIRFEIRSTYGDYSNDLAGSQVKEAADRHRDSFKRDLDSSRLGLFILRFKATLLQGSCAIDPVPGSSTSTAGTNIWFEVPYNTIPTMDGDEDVVGVGSRNALSSSTSSVAAAVASSSSVAGEAMASATLTTVAGTTAISPSQTTSAPAPLRDHAKASESTLDQLDLLDSVLVVDGDHTAVMVICTVIQSLGIKQIDVALGSEQGEHHMKLRPYSVVFFNPLILPELNGYVCVQRFRDWEKTHRPSRQFICGISAAMGARALCKKAGMDECILKVNSGLHVKSLVRRFREIHREMVRAEPMVDAVLPNAARISGEETAATGVPSQTIDEGMRWDGASIEIPQTKTGKIKADEMDIDIDAFRQQMQNKTGDLQKFVVLFIRSGQKIVLRIRAALDRQGDEDVKQKYEDLRNEAHALKGAAMMMCAKPLSRLSFKLEKYCFDVHKRAVSGDDSVCKASGTRAQVATMVEDVEQRWAIAVEALKNI